jgi:uncharacterized membrane protein YgcG
MVSGKRRLFSVIITGFVLGMLVLIGPAEALNLSLSGFRTTPYQVNEVVSFQGKIIIEEQEIVPLTTVELEVNDEIVCVFDINGNKLSSCEGVNVSLISKTIGYGYGYGYGSFERGWNGGNRSSNAGNYNVNNPGYGYGYGGLGELEYNITIETPQDYLRIPGENDLKLIARTSSQIFNSRTEKIVLRPNTGGNNGNSGGNQGNSGGSSGESGGGSGLVTICHIPNGDLSLQETLRISSRALNAHLSHGDYVGECEGGGFRNLANEGNQLQEIQNEVESGITGAVTGASNMKKTLIPFIFISLVFALAIYLQMNRTKKKNNFKKLISRISR